MNKKEIDELRLLTLPKKYTIMTNEEFTTIKEGFKDLQSQLDKSNNKIEQYKKQVDSLRKLCRERIESCNAAIGNPDNTIISKTQLLLNEVASNKRFLSIIDGSDE